MYYGEKFNAISHLLGAVLESAGKLDEARKYLEQREEIPREKEEQ